MNCGPNTVHIGERGRGRKERERKRERERGRQASHGHGCGSSWTSVHHRDTPACGHQQLLLAATTTIASASTPAAALPSVFIRTTLHIIKCSDHTIVAGRGGCSRRRCKACLLSLPSRFACPHSRSFLRKSCFFFAVPAEEEEEECYHASSVVRVVGSNP